MTRLFRHKARLLRQTSNLNLFKKSIPRIGNFTAAIWNSWKPASDERTKDNRREPNEAIGDPFDAENVLEEGETWGKQVDGKMV
jgi:hypothetical protein